MRLQRVGRGRKKRRGRKRGRGLECQQQQLGKAPPTTIMKGEGGERWRRGVRERKRWEEEDSRTGRAVLTLHTHTHKPTPPHTHPPSPPPLHTHTQVTVAACELTRSGG